jgi:hypothetical protein
MYPSTDADIVQINLRNALPFLLAARRQAPV